MILKPVPCPGLKGVEKLRKIGQSLAVRYRIDMNQIGKK